MTTAIAKFIFVAAAALPLAGCMSSGKPEQTAPALRATPPSDEALTIVIRAPAQRVQAAIISRARSRGTGGTVANPRTVVLERALQQTPPGLEAVCGAHQLGRIVRIVISTNENPPGETQVEERRYVVDGAKNCPVKLSPGDIESGNKSLEELKLQVESASAQR